MCWRLGIIHVGFAMNRIDEQEAAETLQLLKEIADTQEDLLMANG